MNRIRELRQEKGWTQTQLGARVGMAKTTISGYEKGDHQVDPEMICEAAQAEELRRAAVDHLPREGSLVLRQDGAAADAAGRLIHGRVPGSTGTVSCRGREPWD